ncbi:MAG: hypothetical protein U0841_05000 [Chloroflexia bacterium]
MVITDIACAIPPNCFDEALTIHTGLDKDEQSAAANWWLRRIAEFTDIVRTRQRLMKEIPL